MKERPIRIECYSGYKADETPRWLWIGDQRIRIDEILERWRQSDLEDAATVDYFRVLGGGRVYLLGHDRDDDRWFLATS